MAIDTIDTTETVQRELTATFSIQPTDIDKGHSTSDIIQQQSSLQWTVPLHYHTHRLHVLFSIKQQVQVLSNTMVYGLSEHLAEQALWNVLVSGEPQN